MSSIGTTCREDARRAPLSNIDSVDWAGAGAGVEATTDVVATLVFGADVDDTGAGCCLAPPLAALVEPLVPTAPAGLTAFDGAEEDILLPAPLELGTILEDCTDAAIAATASTGMTSREPRRALRRRNGLDVRRIIFAVEVTISGRENPDDDGVLLDVVVEGLAAGAAAGVAGDEDSAGVMEPTAVGLAPGACCTDETLGIIAEEGGKLEGGVGLVIGFRGCVSLIKIADGPSILAVPGRKPDFTACTARFLSGNAPIDPVATSIFGWSKELTESGLTTL